MESIMNYVCIYLFSGLTAIMLLSIFIAGVIDSEIDEYQKCKHKLQTML